QGKTGPDPLFLIDKHRLDWEIHQPLARTKSLHRTLLPVIDAAVIVADPKSAPAVIADRLHDPTLRWLEHFEDRSLDAIQSAAVSSHPQSSLAIFEQRKNVIAGKSCVGRNRGRMPLGVEPENPRPKRPDQQAALTVLASRRHADHSIPGIRT